MILVMELRNEATGGFFKLTANLSTFNGRYEDQPRENLFTIAWNIGIDQSINVNGEQVLFPKDAVTTFTANQSFEFENPSDIIAWQFNRPFYCIVNHDAEVSCAGLIFYGSSDLLMIQLDAKERPKIELLFNVFKDEFEEIDNLQEDMIRMLLKRLIIKITRLYKVQNNISAIIPIELDLVRQYNLLVEQHFKDWHQVQDYANELNKSPKTLSNLFSKFSPKSPLKIIHERLILEAKRLLIYTDYTIKEIAYELGFQEVPPFNRLFKKIATETPSDFRKNIKV